MTRAPGSAPPPSERGGAAPGDWFRSTRRIAEWGWGVTIALALLVGVILVVGYLRNDPGRNPAPTAYREAVCAAFDKLTLATEALTEANAGAHDTNVRSQGIGATNRHLVAASELLEDLPDWAPGEPFNELIASHIVGLADGAAALRSGQIDMERITELNAAGHRQLTDGSLGFTCPEV